MRICDLREKEVINICAPEKLHILLFRAPANFLVCWVEKKNTSLKYAISVKSEQI